MQLIWYRNDLRTLDHNGLAAAADSGQQVVALFIRTEKQWSEQLMAERKKNFIYAQLEDLSASLAKLNIPLIIDTAPSYSSSVKVLLKYCNALSVEQVHLCHEYELNEVNRDRLAAEKLNDKGISLNSYHDSLIFPPGAICKQDGSPYGVFSAYKRRWMAALQQQLPSCAKKIRPISANKKGALLPEAIANKTSTPPYKKDKYWVPSEKNTLKQLRYFCKEHAHAYEDQRDYPELEGTSRLSPHFSIGALSPRQAFNRLLAEQGDSVFHEGQGAHVWLSELIWREFYRHLSATYPDLSKGFCVKQKYDTLAWRNDKDEFDAWCEGRTGFPIVDAAMRQLNATGWMHNRLRMIVASFLIKDLQIDWHWGESYFMEKLVDGDYAANNGGWQWSASTGHDAAPYFRIFNPTRQGERFDKDGAFIKRYCPELSDVPSKCIHEPQKYAKKAGITLSYPTQIVDHSVARELTLTLYKSVD